MKKLKKKKKKRQINENKWKENTILVHSKNKIQKRQVAHIILAFCCLIILVIVSPIVDPDSSFGLCGIV